MKIKAVLFDLDGTLLPMDLNVFFKEYFKLLAGKLAPYGYEPKQLVKTIWDGVVAVENNDGSKVNEDLFWGVFESVYGVESRAHRKVLDEFYLQEFQQLKALCGKNDDAGRTVKEIRSKGLRTVVATKPIFPNEAIISRMKWAGVDEADFEFYTSYSNFNSCKPSGVYYRQIAEKLGLAPEECLMVGNDVSEDMVASEIGMKVFLLTDWLINTEEKDISVYAHGSFDDLLNYIEELM